jgi:acyl-coenzyme A synthetase/AMP-(fatty) acid ligase
MLLFPSKLVEYAEAEKVTVWKGVSSLLMYLARTGAISRGRLPTLRTILFSGETLHAKYLIEWMRTFPEKTFYNAYGPTEATGISMYYRIDKTPASIDERIPIGKPCENTEVFLLDENYKAVPQGMPGELCIKGVCLSKGYLNDPERTKQVFIDNPLNPGKGERIYLTGDSARLLPDGNYEFIGRRDDQIKFMGYRMELSDIEHALVSINGVRDAGAVLVESEGIDLKEPVAYVEIDSNTSLASIMQELKNRLPHYMVPKRLCQIEHLPRTDRGKIDKMALATYHSKRCHKG